MKRILVLSFALGSFVACKQPRAGDTRSNGGDSKQVQATPPVFEKVAATESHLDFSNTITDDVGTRANLFDYDYFYNGSGVGLEDLNNDGLPDIFFCGNQVPNKLFLNKGNLSFEDVSSAAGINQGKGWANGVTFADVNEDGWMDIYVCQAGPVEREARRNQLFINQQDGNFKEMGKSYGLDDPGISVQAAFFDFDKDGDLDCVVMNESELFGVDPINFSRIIENELGAKYYNSSHLYRNDKGHYTDITGQAGLERPVFGLGLSVGDIDSDGWLDIYIASDYYLPDALFINNHDGTFTDRIKNFTQQISYYGMGIDIADINNDALQDIFILDMSSSDHVRAKTLMVPMSARRFDYLVNESGYQPQYMFNSLQLNLGQDHFSNIAQLTGMANTDWSWAVILSDFDLDGDKDVYVTNGYRRYALDNDLQQKVFAAKQRYGSQVPLEVKQALYNEMPSERLPNILYENQGDLQFENRATTWGLADFSFSNGAAAGDLDNDGDLDIVVNNINDNAFLYRNTSIEQGRGHFLKVKTNGRTSEPFAKVELLYDGKSQLIENKRVRGYMSALEPAAHFGLGATTVVDTVRVTWLNGKMEEKHQVPANSTLTFNESEASREAPAKKSGHPWFATEPAERYGLDFVHRENIYDDFDAEILLPYKQSQMGPYLAKGDVDGDGIDDLYVGGASGQAGQLYVQTSTGFRKKTVPVFETDRTYEDMEAVFFDLDTDGDMDLYVTSGGYEFEENSSLYADRLYINDGKGNFKRADAPALRSFPKSGKAVTAFDFDKDGDMDILVGNRLIPKKYPQASPSVLFENDGGTLRDVTEEKAPELTDFGIVNAVLATDFNNDGWIDFIALGEWTGIGLFENHNGKFVNIAPGNDALNQKGWWFSATETDLNGDGLKDYILGNVGLNFKYKAEKNQPFKIYAADFDRNGTNDIVMAEQYHGTYVPVRGREYSSQQMPFIQQKFPTYLDFANASLTDIYGDRLKDAYEREADQFRSLILINKGKGVFESKPLPIEAQIFPVMATVATDINGDGFEDVILAGNIYETEVETPRMDAISGLVLLSNGKDGYIPQPYGKTGLYLDGNVKDLLLIRYKNNSLLINTTNNGPLGVHRLDGTPKRPLAVSP